MTEMLTRAAGTTIAPGAAPLDEIDGPLRCVRIDDVTHDVKTFGFEAPDGGLLRFRPGQYLTFGFDIDRVQIERCYTISSPPTRPQLLTITVKRVPGGPVSNWLHDHLAVGDRVRVSGPFGRFSVDEHPAPRYLFLSAGSGITPLMSMTRTLLDRADPSDVVFVHNARTPADIIFRRELETVAAQARMSVAAICEDDSPGEQWTGARGLLSLPLLWTLAPDLLDREVLVCGPPAYMEAVRGLLERAGADPARCHQESFCLGALIGDPDDAPPTAPEALQRYTVEFRRSGRVVECDTETTVLDAALGAGVSVPSSCGEGMCGTCKSGLLSGQVDMDHAGGIRPREIADGKILLCCSTPCGDLVIDG
ncbi:MAG: FAD-binding oxidoreductase [Nocardioidaceae bacterium]